MSKPTLQVCLSYNRVLTPDTKLAMDALFNKYAKAYANERARDRLAWCTNLVSDKRYRLCPDGCGLVFMSRHNKGEHIDPAELIADSQTDEPQEAEAFMSAPVEMRLRPAASIAQVRWAADMIAQYPRKTKEQICRENGGISWEQLQHYAQSDTKGLPERKGQKAPTKNAPAKTATKAKATPRRKAREA
jgi:hypothetical protein